MFSKDVMGQWFLANFIMLIITPIVCLIPYVALVACPIMIMIVIPMTNFVFFWKYLQSDKAKQSFQNMNNSYKDMNDKIMNMFSFKKMGMEFPKKNQGTMNSLDEEIKKMEQSLQLKDKKISDKPSDDLDVLDKLNMKDITTTTKSGNTKKDDKKTKDKDSINNEEYNKMKQILNINTQKIKDLEEDMDLIDEEKEAEEAKKKKMPEKKRSRIGMIIGIIMFILILSGLIAAIIVMQKKNTINPRELINY